MGDFACDICGKKSNEVTVCCSLSEYEVALQHSCDGYKTVSLRAFRYLRDVVHFRDIENLFFVCRLSKKRSNSGAKGEYIDLHGVYGDLSVLLFSNFQLLADDQYRAHIMVRRPKEENYYYNNL